MTESARDLLDPNQQSVGQYLELLKRSRLLNERDLLKRVVEVLAQFPQADSGQLGREFVRRNILTDWQDDKLQAGRFEGFFLGKYKLLGHLGGGGACLVYLGEHVVLGRRVAIKILRHKLVRESTYVERVLLEARATATLKHPNVVFAYDVGSVGDVHYFVMEFVQGIDLAALVGRTGPLRYDQAVDYLIQAASGLHHAHEHGLVHRDVKPANLLLDSSGVLKVLDLGLARIEEPGLTSMTLDNDEKLLGTVDYLAPEQAQDSHDVDHRADIYALGCTLYFLLTGQAPFASGSAADRLIKHQFEDPRAICSLRPDAPPELATICERMMAKLPADRYQSMEDVIRILNLWLTAFTHEQASSDTQHGGGKPDTRILLRRDALDAIKPQGSKSPKQ